ncbi:MAG: response regulator [Alphaproteobacteria bacterium]
MRILLADDHALVRQAIKAYITLIEPNAEVLEATTLPEALGVVAENPGLDLVLLDLMMPGMDGLAGLEAMLSRHPTTPVAILSALDGRENVLTALERGAAGYIPKTLGARAMMAALQLMLAGEVFVPSFAVRAHAPDGPRLLPAERDGRALASLTGRQRQVLALLTQGHTNKEIAGRLGVKPITVAGHLKAVFRKLGVSSRTQALRVALDRGFPA